MEKLNLEPYAVYIRWSFSDKRTGEKWKELIEEFLDDLGNECVQEKGVIGHIKCLSRLPGGEHIRGSKISSNYSADVEYSQDFFAIKELNMILNVLVYGISFYFMSQLVNSSAKKKAEEKKIEVAVHPGDYQHNL